MQQQQQEDLGPQVELEIKFDRANQTYKPTEWITGVIKVINPYGGMFQPFFCNNITVLGEGIMTAQNKQTNKQLEQVTQGMGTTYLFKNKIIIAEEENISPQNNSFPFKMKFLPEQNQKLVETYVGVYISVAYEVSCTIKQQNGRKISQAQPFYVQCPGQGQSNIKGNAIMPRPAEIEMSPSKLLQQKTTQQVPNFKVIGRLETDIAYFHDDIRGSFIIEECEGKIRTIDLQLIRVEKIENKNGKFQEATEIQLIQVADGNVSRKIEIPLYMIYPVYFSCPNFQNNEYQVDFEVNFIMILFDGFKITLNFPLNILRQ